MFGGNLAIGAERREAGELRARLPGLLRALFRRPVKGVPIAGRIEVLLVRQHELPKIRSYR